MSRTRTYGRAVAVQISGPQAVENVEKATNQAADMLSRHFGETMRHLSAVGVTLDVDTYVTHVEENDDQIVFTWTCDGRQKRSLIRRLLWAARL